VFVLVDTLQTSHNMNMSLERVLSSPEPEGTCKLTTVTVLHTYGLIMDAIGDIGPLCVPFTRLNDKICFYALIFQAS
jgi:hypothetical protein